MSPLGLKAAFHRDWFVAARAQTCLYSRKYVISKRTLFSMMTLHCFCRSNGTEKNSKHFDLVSAPTKAYDVRRSLSFIFVHQSRRAKYRHSFLIVGFLFIYLYRILLW